jgi:MHS family citrate/tricarballylate:H+ symporter-like MFS transporter
MPARPAEIDHEPGPATPVGLGKVVAVGMGNALEFYDFLTFSFFSTQIGHCFFPNATGKHSLLYTLATFGVGFAVRPLGGILIGRYGDRAGRKPAMLLSFTLMGVAILGVALTPSYSQIGAAAPVLLVLFRLVQGFALGGEVGPSTAYLIEAAPPNRRGLYVSIQYATQDCAPLVAGVVGFVLSLLLTAQQLDTWGWRLAFLFGAAIVPFGLWMRRALPEAVPPDALSLEPTAGANSALKVPARLIVLGVVMLASGTISGYVLTYLTTYAQDSLKMSARLAFAATIVFGLAEVCADLTSGRLSDRFGRRPMMLIPLLLLTVFVVPLFMLMNETSSVGVAIAAMAVVSILVAMNTTPMLVSITESLPRGVRSGALATMYACTISVFGGTTQVVVKWLTDLTGSPLAPAWYVTVALLFGGTAAFLTRETAPARAASAAGPN